MSDLWTRLQARAVEIHDGGHLQERLRRGDRLRVKLGLDPTAPDIHVGHLVVLDTLRLFQDEGHTAVLIIGDHTALIGDPSGRSETRPVLTPEQVDANARTYFEQAFRVLDRDRTEIRHNSEWLGPMSSADILRLLGRQTLQQVLQREDFANRLREGAPIGAHEILYPFNQAYDSVAVRADLEIGGTDQLFNLLFGREIQRAYDQPAQDVAVFPLLEGTDGSAKMSKSLGNYIGITEAPEEIYGKTMRLPDGLTEKYLRLVSGLLPEEQAAILSMPARDAKAALARRLVDRLQGAEAGALAEADFDRRFRRRELPETIPDFDVLGPMPVTEGLVQCGFARSRSEARRLLSQRGVRVNGKVLEEDAPLQAGDVVQVGSRRVIRFGIK